MKLALKHSDKQVVAEKFMELANITFGGLTLTQLFSENMNFVLAIIGILLLIFGYYLAIIFIHKKD